MESSNSSLKLPEAFLTIIFFVLSGWWALLYFKNGSVLTDQNLIWAAVYQIAALWGAVWGLIISRSWGGVKSLMGRALMMFSIGLLFQNFGQTVFSIYNLVLKVEVPYPSIADIGFFGSIAFYVYGTYLVGKICGAKFSLNSFWNKAVAVVVPLVLLIFSYRLFLNGYEFDPTNPLKTFLDFGYPLGQALYISLAMLVYILSKNYLGGIMRHTMMLILVALSLQYVADFNFLMQAGNSTWINGGYGDYLYLVSYTVMAFALIQFGTVLSRIRNNQS